jgi:hypothetical protein
MDRCRRQEGYRADFSPPFNVDKEAGHAIGDNPVYPRWAMPKGDGLDSYRLTWTGSLGVALRAQPRYAALAIHPVIDIGLAGKAGDFPGGGARVLGHNIPVGVLVPDGLEGHSCFCHALLCRFFNKKKPPCGARVLCGHASNASPARHCGPSSSPLGRAPPKILRPSGARHGFSLSHGTNATYWPSAWGPTASGG